MKKLILELSQGSVHLGAWKLGDEPLNLRIIDEEEVLFELSLRAPQKKASASLFGRQQGDDFTMPLPLGEDIEDAYSHGREHAEYSSSPFDLSQMVKPSANQKTENHNEEELFIKEAEQNELSFEMSASLLFGDDFESKIPEEDEPIIDFDALVEVVIEEDALDFVSPEPSDVLSILQASISRIDDSLGAPPVFPDLPGISEVDIAVWKQVGGHWTCIERLKANEEFFFHSVKIWVDNNASLLLTGRSDVEIVVQNTDGSEENIHGLNGSLELPSRAIVLLREGDEYICFRPE